MSGRKRGQSPDSDEEGADSNKRYRQSGGDDREEESERERDWETERESDSGQDRVDDRSAASDAHRRAGGDHDGRGGHERVEERHNGQSAAQPASSPPSVLSPPLQPHPVSSPYPPSPLPPSSSSPSAYHAHHPLSPSYSASYSGGEEEIRLLVDSSQVGGLIGRQGVNVNGIKDQSGAHVSIIKQDRGPQDRLGPQPAERVATVRGAEEQIVKAIKLIAELLLANPPLNGRPEDVRSGDATSTSIRLLVQEKRVGAIIGKSGESVRETQQLTGARVSVTQEPLGQSTEKAIAVSGTPAVISAAFARILQQLRLHPLRDGAPTVEYVPPLLPAGAALDSRSGSAGSAAAPPPPSAYPPPPPGYYPPPGYPPYGYPPPPPHAQGGSPYAPPPPPGAGGPPPPYPPYGYPYPPPPGYGRPPYPMPHHIPLPVREAPVSQKIAIPTVCSGCVLGKGGSIIKELRAQSGTNISLADPDPETPNERIVTITGPPSNIQHAIYLIREAVEKYVPPAGMYKA